MPEEVGNSELLARFVFQRRHLYQDGQPKPAAFLPNSNNETSVSRVDSLSDQEIYIEGKECERRRTDNPTLYGRALVGNEVVLDLNLRTVKDEPPPRHANIVGWPLEQSEKKLIALGIAEEANGLKY
ncbi:MAG: hypothetical protein O7C75_21540 [Verrucomicrobia bacterium]|nr:hypothetical protein [Verrucomicrobiota bacterium]